MLNSLNTGLQQPDVKGDERGAVEYYQKVIWLRLLVHINRMPDHRPKAYLPALLLYTFSHKGTRV